jgi:hypothetical protein
MTDIGRAMAIAAGADARRLEQAYWLAVAAGAANTRCGEASELTHGALQLLTLSTLRLPDLALQAYLLDIADCAGVDAPDFELRRRGSSPPAGCGSRITRSRRTPTRSATSRRPGSATRSHARGRVWPASNMPRSREASRSTRTRFAARRSR